MCIIDIIFYFFFFVKKNVGFVGNLKMKGENRKEKLKNQVSGHNLTYKKM
jgi:hypothetical protein